MEQAKELCHLKGHYFLTIDEAKELKQFGEDETTKREEYLELKTSERVFPLWYLVISLCSVWQETSFGGTFTREL